MLDTTLGYIEQDGKYLLLCRNKKKNDVNEGKWIGIGGKLEPGETPDECFVREVKEETGLEIRSFHFYGVIHFRNDEWEDEEMYLYSSSDFTGDVLPDCTEGELHWVDKDKILSMPTWEGDPYFLKPLLAGEDKIELTLNYIGGKLSDVIDAEGRHIYNGGTE